VAVAQAQAPDTGGGRAAGHARALHQTTFDAEECYRVRDVSLVREDIKMYFNEGSLIFGRPVEGRIHNALFVAADGDGEVLLMPPTRGERASLASFTGSPNLNERIRTALLIFSDNTAIELKEALGKGGEPRKLPEMGMLVAQQWNSVLQNFTGSLELRLVQDALANRAPGDGFFYAAVNGLKAGNFDMFYDPLAREQVTIGQVVFRDDRSFFDVWSSFVARSFRSGRKHSPEAAYSMDDVRIEATIDTGLHMKAVTRGTLRIAAQNAEPLAFEVSRRMRIDQARLDGEPVEMFQRDSLRANLVRGPDNEVFLVVPGRPLEAGSVHQIEFEHHGDVIMPAGNRVFFVGSRGNWYPRTAYSFTTCDLTFRYPQDLNLVATGDVVEERTEGEWRISHRRTGTPVRFAGFNLGVYDKVVSRSGGYTVEVYANRKVEPGLPHPRPVLADPWPQPPRRRSPGDFSELSAATPPPPDPAARLRALAADVAGALEFLAGAFGPPPLKTLTVSPIPGSFGQGFPGLVYLSTLSYLPADQRSGGLADRKQTLFFGELLPPHEVAHQWWGNKVITTAYQDEWIMEAIANYAAFMYLEKRKGAKAMASVLDQARHELLAKTDEGKTLESVGPITWGTRLQRSETPDAWRNITYNKGAWILHMLRRRLGDERFVNMLRDLCRDYQFKSLSTEAFRAFAARYLPPGSSDAKLEDFFEQWVQGTGIPGLKVNYTAKGRAPAVKVTGTVAQSEVEEDYAGWVPLVIQFARGKPQVAWVRTSSDAPAFSMTLKQAPTKVSVDAESILAR
jgi:hypothetical protein